MPSIAQAIALPTAFVVGASSPACYLEKSLGGTGFGFGSDRYSVASNILTEVVAGNAHLFHLEFDVVLSQSKLVVLLEAHCPVHQSSSISITRTPPMSSLAKRLNEIESFEDDWDGYGGKAPFPMALARAQAFEQKWRSELEAFSAGPLSGGEVHFWLHRGSSLVEFEFDDSNNICVFVGRANEAPIVSELVDVEDSERIAAVFRSAHVALRSVTSQS